MKTYYLRGLLVSAMAPLGIPSFNVGQRRLKGLDGMIFVRGGGFNEPSKHSRVVFLPAETGGVNGPSELGKGEEVDWNQNEETPPPNRQLWDIQKFKERSNILETSYSVPLTPKACGLLGGNNEAADLPQKRFAALLQRRLAMCSIGVFTLYMSLGELLIPDWATRQLVDGGVLCYGAEMLTAVRGSLGAQLGCLQLMLVWFGNDRAVQCTLRALGIVNLASMVLMLR
eukprot:281923_1